ncbi:N-acetyltransferase family protein [Rhizobium binxianense]
MVVGGLVIRPMTAADHDAVGLVGFAAWQSSGALDRNFADPGIVEAARREFLAYPPTAKGEVVIAELDGRVVGWVAREGDPGYVSDLWVSPDRQRRGVGASLIGFLCGRMRSEGLRLVRLDTHANNIPAIGLYEKLGFGIVWRGIEFQKSLQIYVEKVHLEKALIDG